MLKNKTLIGTLLALILIIILFLIFGKGLFGLNANLVNLDSSSFVSLPNIILDQDFEVYELNEDIDFSKGCLNSEPLIKITGDNLLLYGNNHKLKGNLTNCNTGIQVEGFNVVVRDLIIEDFKEGLKLNYANNSDIRNVSIKGTSECAFCMWKSFFNNFEKFNFINGNLGIKVIYGAENYFNDLLLNNFSTGVFLDISSDNYFSDISFLDILNKDVYYGSGSNNIFASSIVKLNKCKNLDIQNAYYYFDSDLYFTSVENSGTGSGGSGSITDEVCFDILKDGIILDGKNKKLISESFSNSIGVRAQNIDSLKIYNFNLVGYTTGIYFAGTFNSSVTNVSSVKNSNGFVLENSDSNNFTKCVISDSSIGVSLLGSNSNNFNYFDFSDNSLDMKIINSNNNYFFEVNNSKISEDELSENNKFNFASLNMTPFKDLISNNIFFYGGYAKSNDFNFGNFNTQKKMSLSFWLNQNQSMPYNSTILNLYNTLILYAEANTSNIHFVLNVKNNSQKYSIYGKIGLLRNGWNHLFMSLDNHLIYYLNGEIRKDLNITELYSNFSLNIISDNLYLASSDVDDEDSFIGQFDELRFYDNVLNIDRIKAIYESGRKSNATLIQDELISWFPMNEPSGDILMDLIYGNDLILKGNYFRVSGNDTNPLVIPKAVSTKSKEVYLNFNENGVISYLNLGWKSNFRILNKNYSLFLSQVQQDMASFILYPNTISFVLEKGESRLLDLDFDGLSDLEILLLEVNSTGARYVLSKVDDQIIGLTNPVEDSNYSNNTEPKSLEYNNQNYSKAFYYFAVIIITLMILLAIALLTIILIKEHSASKRRKIINRI